MSARVVLLLIVLASAAASEQSSRDLGNLHRSLKRTHLALVISKLLSVARSRKFRRYQINVPIVGAPNNRLGERPGSELPYYWFKVCTMCPKYTCFLRNLEEKEAATEEAVGTTLIHQIVLKALEEASLKPPVIKPRSEEKIQQHCQLQN